MRIWLELSLSRSVHSVEGGRELHQDPPEAAQGQGGRRGHCHSHRLRAGHVSCVL